VVVVVVDGGSYEATTSASTWCSFPGWV
jgi:hypothetical protein